MLALPYYHLCECGCGKPINPNSRFTRGHHRKGVKFSSEHCLLISASAKQRVGSRNPNFGHHKLKGTKIPEERRLRIIQSQRALPKDVLFRRSMLGVKGLAKKKENPDFRKWRSERIKEGVLRRYADSPEIKDVLRAKRLQQKIPVKDTSIERKLGKLLVEKGIPFVAHKSVLNLTQPDFFVDPNICIFADGCYWHGCPQCYAEAKLSVMQKKRIIVDSMVTQTLLKNGYVVLRFWEHDLRHNLDKCLVQVENALTRPCSSL